MHDSEPYGYLLIAGQDVTDRELSAQSGLPVRHITRGREELENKGVIERDGRARIFNPRMVRDEQIHQRRVREGKLGGNPKLKAEDNPEVNLGDKPQIPDTRYQIQTKKAQPTAAPKKVSPSKNGQRGTQLPESWQPNQGHRDLATQKQIDIADEYEKFGDHAKSLGRVCRDWDAAFRNWLRKAPEFKNGRPPPGSEAAKPRNEYPGKGRRTESQLTPQGEVSASGSHYWNAESKRWELL